MNSVKTPGDNPVSLKEWDRIIIGVDPGTNVMGYGILGVKSKTGHDSPRCHRAEQI